MAVIISLVGWAISAPIKATTTVFAVAFPAVGMIAITATMIPVVKVVVGVLLPVIEVTIASVV